MTLVRAYYPDGTIRVWNMDPAAIPFLMEGLMSNTPNHRPIRIVIESISTFHTSNIGVRA